MILTLVVLLIKFANMWQNFSISGQNSLKSIIGGPS